MSSRILRAVVRYIAFLTYTGLACRRDARCPCGGRLTLPTAHPDLLRCGACGLVGHPVRLTADATEQFYRSGLYRRMLHGTRQPPADHLERGRRRGEEIKLFLREHGCVAPKSVLEIGCGTGGLLLAFARPGVALYGVELDSVAAGIAWSNGIRVNTGGTRDVDLVLLSHVLEHSHDPLRMLADAAGSLRFFHGTMFLAWPIYDGALTPDAPWHNWYFTAECIRQMATRIGIRCSYVSEGMALLRRVA